jgi:iron(III) transport system permease protein
VILAWWLLGLAAFVLLPWYFPQNQSLWQALGGAFGGSETASGLVQALRHDRPWLWFGLLGLLAAGAALWLPAGRAQGLLLLVATGAALCSLLISGFAIGAQGWSSEWLEGLFGALPNGQFGVGPGGAIALLALLMLLGTGVARLGYFRGDLFVAGSVMLCAALLLLFVAFPVGKSLIGAWLDEAGQFSPGALADRLAHERV